jgi:hypothetical protein
VLGANEHQRPARAAGELGRDRDLVGRLHGADLVVHPVGGRGGRDRMPHRVGQVAADEGVDLAVEGG